MDENEKKKSNLQLVLWGVVLLVAIGFMVYSAMGPSIKYEAGDCIGNLDKGGVGRMDCTDPAATYKLVEGGNSCQAGDKAIVLSKGKDESWWCATPLT